MKNKTTTYALLALVLCLWGYIVYKIYMGVKGDDVALPVAAAKSKPSKEKEPMAIDNYELSLNYRDPFLGKQGASTVVSSAAYSGTPRPVVVRPRVAAPAVVSPPKPQEAIDWSVIRFHGIMKNPTTNKMISIVMVNNQQYMLGEGGVGGGVKVLKVYKDSLRISYKNINKTITR